jgi:ABC-2 type transport system permease protein
MNVTLRAEVLKLRTTRTTAGIALGMVGVAMLTIALHAFGLPIDRVSDRADQVGVFIDVGVGLGLLFAALLGAMSMTGEVRHGTIRPTLIVTPRRGRVVAAKSATSVVTGFMLGVVAASVVAIEGSVALSIRDVPVQLTAADYWQLVLGAGLAAALWAVIGLGVGAMVRNQVPAVVGLMVWVLFVENILFASFPGVGKFAPGTLGQTIAGQTADSLDSPAVALLILALHATAAIALGWLATTRRDFA